jgi:hypothetical protein
MPFAMKSLCVLFILLLAVALGRCGQLSNTPKNGPADGLTRYIPEGWDGSTDWSGNTLKIEDTAP